MRPSAVTWNCAGAHEHGAAQLDVFVEGITRGVIRELSDEEMAEYRRPFAMSGEDRRPTLS
jgi:haloalkane dehalogenase